MTDKPILKTKLPIFSAVELLLKQRRKKIKQGTSYHHQSAIIQGQLAFFLSWSTFFGGQPVFYMSNSIINQSWPLGFHSKRACFQNKIVQYGGLLRFAAFFSGITCVNRGLTAFFCLLIATGS